MLICCVFDNPNEKLYDIVDFIIAAKQKLLECIDVPHYYDQNFDYLGEKVLIWDLQSLLHLLIDDLPYP